MRKSGSQRKGQESLIVYEKAYGKLLLYKSSEKYLEPKYPLWVDNTVL